MFNKKEKGQTSIEMLIVISGILILAIVVIMIIISTGSAKADDITKTDSSHTQLLDKSVFPPTIDSMELIDSEDTNVTIELNVIDSLSPNVKDYCLVVNDKITNYCNYPTDGKLIFSIPKEERNYYVISLISRSNQNTISSNSIALTASIASVGTDPGTPGSGGTLNFSCPLGYTKVPGDNNYGTTYNKGGFCVMTYEAKVDTNNDGIGEQRDSCMWLIPNTGNPRTWHNTICNLTTMTPVRDYNIVSSGVGYPLTGIITLTTAKNICKNGVVYDSAIYEQPHLMTNEERMTISRNLEQVSNNWSVSIGIGVFRKGMIYGNNVTGISYGITRENGFIDSVGRTGGNRTSTSPARLLLNNRETNENDRVIWDFVGNVSEWIDKSMSCSNLPRGTSGEYIEFNQIYSDGQLESKYYKPSNNYWLSNLGMGKVRFDFASNGTCYFLLGDFSSIDNSDASYRGLYNISAVTSSTLPTTPSSTAKYGLRCVIVPK